MPKGPQGQERPADVIGNAIMVAQIATGEREEISDGGPIGAAGGKARAEKLAPERRSEIASLAAKRRWQNEGTNMQTPNKETVARGREAVRMYPNNSLKEPVREYRNLVAEVVKEAFTK